MGVDESFFMFGDLSGAYAGFEGVAPLAAVSVLADPAISPIFLRRL